MNRCVTRLFFLVGDSSVKDTQKTQKQCDISIRMRISQKIQLKCLFLHLR
jgi:hypothetical protein